MQNLNALKMIERINILVRSEERKRYAILGLQPIHVQVLEYLNNCNSYSNTAGAITEYFGLTKGTVSQTLQVLERKGYLNKHADAEDTRIIHLILSPEGDFLLQQLQLINPLIEIEKTIGDDNFNTLEDALFNALNVLQKTTNAKSFGSCNSCVNFDVEDEHYLCRATRLPVYQIETHKICREHVSVNFS